jgi:archaemetzincin
MLTFVYGQAQLGGRAAIVSLARLRQEYYRLPANPALLQARARKEAVHETGHLFGLVHCEADACAMRLSTTVRQIDLKSELLCAACAERAWENAV